MPQPVKPAEDQVKNPPRHQTPDRSTSSPPLMDEDQIDGSMHTEEPTGWDQAPKSIKDPEHKRHPRPDGIGGLKPAPDLKTE